MQRWIIVAAWIYGGVSGCEEKHDEAFADAQLVPLCGEDGPVRVLAVAGDEVFDAPRIHDDRVIISVSAADASPTDGAVPEEGRAVSVDACGRDERVLVDRYVGVYLPESADAPWLAGRPGELLWIDPMGERAPTFVGDAKVLAQHERAWYLGLSEEPGWPIEIVRFEVDGDDFTLEPVMDGVVTHTGFGSSVRPGTMLVVDGDAQLLELALDSGDTTVVASNVTDFDVVRESRFILWHSGRDDASTSLLRPWFLLDRETGAVVQVSEDEPVELSEDAVVRVPVGSIGDTAVWLLPGVHAHVLPGHWLFFFPTDDGRILGHRGDLSELWIFDSPDAAPRLVFDGDLGSASVHEGALWVTTSDDRGELTRIPLDGSPRQRVASGVHSLLWLGDGRFAAVTPGKEGYGLLLLVGDGAPQRIDEHAQLSTVNLWIDRDPLRSFFYRARDPDRAGFGLYRVEVAP